MKIKNIFKIIAGVGIVTSVGLTIGLFVPLIPRNFSNVRILTKDAYMKWAKNKDTTIDYSLLPTSQYSIRTVLDNPKSINGGNFMFYFGSQNYAQTNWMLWGLDGSFVEMQGNAPIYENSLVHQILDAFWGENATKLGLNKIDPLFLNYVDMVNQKSLFDAWDTKKLRESTLGNFEPYETDEVDPVTGEFIPYVDKFKWGVGEGRDVVGVPVVKGISDANSPGYAEYNFEPNPDNYYEWRPDDGEDTEYEKVYYRRTDDVYNFLDNYAFMEKYLSNTYGQSGNKEGMLICFRNLNPDDYDSTISNPFDIKVINSVTRNYVGVQSTLSQVISFYNPDYDEDESNTEDDEVVDDNDSSSEDQEQAPPTRTIAQRKYNINQLVENDNFQELNKNLSIISSKEDK